MNRLFCGLVVAVAIAFDTLALAQAETYPIADQIAAKVVAKYENSSCAELKEHKQNPPSGQKARMEQRALQELKQNPQMREHFISKIAGPIANKMFDCGMIP